jgi:hypothetical protein
MDQLGTRLVHIPLWDGDPRRRSDSSELAAIEWTINDEPLAELFGADGHLTLLYASSGDRLECLRRLRGDIVEPPVLAKRFERTWLDKLFRRQGLPWAASGPAFEDGRVCLMECQCGDLDCGALTTQVVISETTVEWRDIGWQVTYEDFADYSHFVRSATFDRAAYESILDGLLAMDWSQVR